MPTEYRYADGALHIGRARIEPVSEAAAEYRVSGMRVIKHWFDYRKRKPSGKRTSDLDNIVPERWTVAMTEELRNLVAVIEGCVELEGQQMDLLARILAGPLLTVDDLTDAGVLPVPPQAKRLNVDRDTNTLF
jgi:predicted alpha/beta-hydrolase family hydrolase